MAGTGRGLADYHQFALDDNRLRHVQARVILVGGEVDRAQHGGRASCLDENAAVNLVGGAAGHEDEATRAGLDTGGVQVGQPDGVRGVGAGELRAATTAACSQYTHNFPPLAPAPA